MTPEELASVGLRLEIDGPVATVTLDRPDVRNAQTPAMWLALGEIGRSLPDDVRVVVVTGEGGTFSAGLDRAMLDPATSLGAGQESVVGLLALSDEDASARIEEFQKQKDARIALGQTAGGLGASGLRTDTGSNRDVAEAASVETADPLLIKASALASDRRSAALRHVNSSSPSQRTSSASETQSTPRCSRKR